MKAKPDRNGRDERRATAGKAKRWLPADPRIKSGSSPGDQSVEALWGEDGWLFDIVNQGKAPCTEAHGTGAPVSRAEGSFRLSSLCDRRPTRYGPASLRPVVAPKDRFPRRLEAEARVVHA